MALDITYFMQLIQNVDPTTPWFILVVPTIYIFIQQYQLKQLQESSDLACAKVEGLSTEFECFKDKILPRLDKIKDKECKDIIERYIERVNRIK